MKFFILQFNIFCVLQESGISCSAAVPACDEAPTHHSVTLQLPQTRGKVKPQRSSTDYYHEISITDIKLWSFERENFKRYSPTSLKGASCLQ